MDAFTVKGGFRFAKAADARAAKKSYQTFYAKTQSQKGIVDQAPPLEALATWSAQEVTFEGEVPMPSKTIAYESLRELQETRWIYTLLALRGVASRAESGEAELRVPAWQDLRKILSGGSVLHVVPDLPPPALRRLGSPAFRHGPYLSAVALSPDGEYLATGLDSHAHFTSLPARMTAGPGERTGTPGDVRLWDLEGSLRQVFSIDARLTNHLWFSPDGAWLAAVTSQGLYALLRETGKIEELALDSDKGVHHFVAAPDGSFIACECKKELVVFDVATRERLGKWAPHRKGHVRSVLALSGGRVATSSDSEGCVWTTAGKLLRQASALQGNLELLPDGRLYSLQTGIIIDPDTGGEEQGEALPYGYRVSDGERRVIALPGGESLVLDGEECALTDKAGKELRRAPSPVRRYMRGSAVSKDGETVWFSGLSALVRLSPRSLTATEDGHPGSVLALSFSDDGAHLASVGWEGELRVWSMATGALERRLRLQDHGAGKLLAWLPQGRGFAAVYNDRLQLVDPAGARDELTLPGHPETLRVSASGRWLAMGCYGKLLLLDLERAELHTIGLPAIEAALFVDERRLLVACHKEMVLLDLEERRFVETLSLPRIYWLFLEQGRIFAWGSGTRAVLDAASGALLKRDAIGKELQGRYRAALSPAGLHADNYEHVLSLRDLVRAKDIFKSSLQSEARALAFSPDGATLATGLEDGSILLWPTPKEEE